MTPESKFVVDLNAGKLAKWLRIMGYDASLFTDKDDGKMIKIALNENRIILTKDTQIMERRLVTSGKVKTILIKGDDPKIQLEHIATALKLDFHFKPFSLCLECNLNLIERSKNERKQYGTGTCLQNPDLLHGMSLMPSDILEGYTLASNVQ